MVPFGCLPGRAFSRSVVRGSTLLEPGLHRDALIETLVAFSTTHRQRLMLAAPRVSSAGVRACDDSKMPRSHQDPEHAEHAYRVIRRYLDAFLARDLDAVAALLAPDYRFEDRRLGMTSANDKTSSLEQLKIGLELGVDKAEVEIIETRGERLALQRTTLSTSTDFAVDVLIVQELDDQDRQVAAVFFDVDAVDAARAELSRRAAVNP